MKAELESCLWPAERASEALFELARAAGYDPRPLRGVQSPCDVPSPREVHSAGRAPFEARIESLAQELDLEIEQVELPYAEAQERLHRAAPALLRFQRAGGEPGWLALLSADARRARMLAPDLSVEVVELERVRAAWCADLERAIEPTLEPLLDRAGLTGMRRRNARRALLAEHVGAMPVGNLWLVKLPPGRSFRLQVRRAGLIGRIAALALASSAASALVVLAWIAIGTGALAGRFEPAWIAAWALLLLTTIPLRVLETGLQASIAIRFGALLKRRLLAGAMRLDPELVRGEGAGHLFARVLESEAFEALALGVGFQAIGATIDVALTMWALSAGPAPLPFLTLFVAFVLAALAVGRRYALRTAGAVHARQESTHDLVERMVGHRTRIAQEDPARWHVEEDRLLERYVESSRRLDRTSLWLSLAVERSWLLVGIAWLGASLLSGSATPVAIAVGLGGVMLGQQALAKLCGGLAQLSSCAIAWRSVRPLFEAASRPVELGLSQAALSSSAEPGAGKLIEARRLVHRYAGRSRPALSDVTLTLRRGQRVLVSGPSGGGKSTLASLVIGWREASSGVLLLDGLDKKSHGDESWNRRVAAAPQFHENHVFTGSFLFNLLLGAGGASRPGARERALAICRELGLGDLLDRMPAGLQQVVGETGWQLSHGEKSRLYIARALLQGGALVVLDESLASLDPASLERVLACCMRRSPSLMLIAHP